MYPNDTGAPRKQHRAASVRAQINYIKTTKKTARFSKLLTSDLDHGARSQGLTGVTVYYALTTSKTLL